MSWCRMEDVLQPIVGVVTVSRWPRSIGFSLNLGKNRGFGFVRFGFQTSIKTSPDVQFECNRRRMADVYRVGTQAGKPGDRD